MLKDKFRKRKTVEEDRCIECGERKATTEDKLCDSCRYSLTIRNIIESKA